MESKGKEILEFMNGSSALVLGGGGARGCFEAGFLMGLQAEKNPEFSIVTGTSIGALIGALYTSGAELQLEDFVMNLKPDHVVKDLFPFPHSIHQLFSEEHQIAAFAASHLFPFSPLNISPLQHSLEEILNYESFKNSSIDFACMSFSLDDLKGKAFYKKDMDPQHFLEQIIASASCFPAFPIQKIDGHSYIDGGYSDNLPVDLAFLMGAEKAVAIDVQGPGIVRSISNPEDVYLVRSFLPLQNFLDFSNQEARRSYELGFRMARRLTGKEEGFLLSFASGQKEKLDGLEKELEDYFLQWNFVLNSERSMQRVRHLLSFSKSDAMFQLGKKRAWINLVETLALLKGADPTKIYTLDELLVLLEDREMKGNDWKEEQKLIASLQELIVQQGTEPAMLEGTGYLLASLAQMFQKKRPV